MTPENEPNPRRGSRNLRFIADWSEAQVPTWTFDWHLKGSGQSYRTAPLTCGIRLYLQVDGVRLKLIVGDPTGVAENCLVRGGVGGEKLTFGDLKCQKCCKYGSSISSKHKHLKNNFKKNEKKSKFLRKKLNNKYLPTGKIFLKKSFDTTSGSAMSYNQNCIISKLQLKHTDSDWLTYEIQSKEWPKEKLIILNTYINKKNDIINEISNSKSQ